MSRAAAISGACRSTAARRRRSGPRRQSEIGIVPSPDGTRVAFVRSSAVLSPDSAAAAGTARRRARRRRRGGDLSCARSPTARETVVARGDADHGDRRPRLVARRQTLVFTDGTRTIRHEQTPAYSGVEDHLHRSPRTCRARPWPSRSGGGARKALGTRRRIRRPPMARRAPFRGRPHVGRFQAPHDVAGRRRRRRAARCCTRTSKTSSGASPATPRRAQPSPDGKWIAFLSDRDGWDHLYVMPAAGGDAVQITKGKFEAWRPAWSPDSTRIAFDANEPDQLRDPASVCCDDRQRSGARDDRAVTNGRGTDIAPQWSPDGTRLVYQHTDPHNSADSVHCRRRVKENRRGCRFDAVRRRSIGVCRARSDALYRSRRPEGAGVAIRAEESRSVEEASGDRVDPWRRREPELRRLARAAQLRRLLQLPPVPAAAGLRGHRAGLSRQHRLRPRLARRRLHGRRRQRRERCVDGGELPEDAATMSTPIASAYGD